MSDADRARLRLIFKKHVRAVRAQVTKFGDVLGKGDPALREELRTIEVESW